MIKCSLCNWSAAYIVSEFTANATCPTYNEALCIILTDRHTYMNMNTTAASFFFSLRIHMTIDEHKVMN